VPPKIQTPRGDQLVDLLGAYYRQRFLKAGLLSGDAAADAGRIYARADNDQRTKRTAYLLARALAPSGEPDVHALAEGRNDPLFAAAAAGVGHPDYALAQAAVLGRIGGQPRVLERAYGSQLAELRGILYGPEPGAGRGTPIDAPFHIDPGKGSHLVELGGSLQVAEVCIDALILAYADGKPRQEVGWGKVDSGVLTDLLAIHDLYFDLVDRTFYLAQVKGSNLASHLVDTLEQGAEGQPVPGALGDPGTRIVILGGHDSNLADLGGLFGMNWCIEGTQLNPTIPGSALVFELWRRGGRYFVRTQYVAATLDQQREVTPLSLEQPPAVAPVFIPGCGGSGPDFDAPLADFVRQARKVINPAFVAPEPEPEPGP
jgi:4-phytase/acid phosphatase